MRKLEHYAMIGDRETAALVASDGSVDWLCAPAFSSRACFSALLGRVEQGCFRLRPVSRVHTVRRRYVEGTLVLETEMACDEGAISITDFMPLGGRAPSIVRIVEGRRGQVRVSMELMPRFDYGSLLPYVRVEGTALIAIGGPDGLSLSAPVALRRDGDRVRADLGIAERERAAFVLSYFPSHLAASSPVDPFRARDECIAQWRAWSERCTVLGPHSTAMLRSLITLKALTYSPTGAAVASPPSTHAAFDAARTWDYRYCWLRDATFTLYALLHAGYRHEAVAWRDWLLRAALGQAATVQTLYGLFGERRLPGEALRWIDMERSALAPRSPEELHSGMFGEVMDAFDLCRRAGIPFEDESWGLQHDLVECLESAWRRPDKGIWEMRGPARHFVHSKVMAWVALDRAVRAVERSGLPGPVDRWRALRVQIHEEVCHRGWDAELGSFVQYYGARWPDASLLMIPLVGFLPATDPRVMGTVAAIERELMEAGLVARFPMMDASEGRFIPCSFWLADTYLLLGRRHAARALFERLLDLANDVGLLAEEYDTVRRKLVGSFPQALSHIALANTARNLEDVCGPARDRSQPKTAPSELRQTG